MAPTQFPVATHRVVPPSYRFLRPPAFPSRRDPWQLPALYSKDIYAQILCQGGNGESLLLTYLRPGTAWLHERPQKPVHRNRWSPATKSGVAYFPASTFALHERLVTAPARPMQISLFAEVDDVYPDGIRIFRTIPLLPVTQDPVPDLRSWLQQHPQICGALQWRLDNMGSRDFSVWPATRQPGQLVNQQDLIDAFALAWNHAGPDLDDPPPNLVDYDAYGVVIDEAHAWQLYIAHAAHSLALEIGGRVPWSLTDYSFDDRGRVLGSGYIVREYPASASPVPNVKCYQVAPLSVPASPRFAYSFLVGNGLIDGGTDAAAARKATIANVLGWCRDNMRHYRGSALRDNMLAVWGYAGSPPVSRVIEGTVSTASPELGVQHFTAGCWGTTYFLQTLLRTANIPLEPFTGGGHTMPHFTTDDLYLSHGDDPYSQLSKCTPAFAADKLLIDSATYNGWFGPAVSQPVQEANVSRRSLDLALQYLPDYMLHAHYTDKLAGLPHDQGSVYKSILQQYYPNFSDVPADLWQRMDDKIDRFSAIPKASEIPPP